ncbi:MAG TPA: type I pantothenate kinase [Acidimicrobiia bacterium]|jgi:type I pantothenate kinase|nr:type I pantothenate kinase [Acidimicrobiia bacterium]
MAPDPVTGESRSYLEFNRDEWRALRSATPLTLDDADLDELRGVVERMPIEEVVDIYLPLSRLLNLSVAASRDLFAVTNRFLGRHADRVPFIIGIAGSVAVGKSTIARVLRALLARWPDHPRVDLIPTDGFLLSNAVLDARGLGARKGFPESYDLRALMRFLADLKAGERRVVAPVYSHLVYDVVEGDEIVVCSPDIVIVEGLNVLQVPSTRARPEERFVSDFFDFSIYVDAAEDDIRRWYRERFLTLRETAFADEESFFHHFAALDEQQASSVADAIWREINAVNLRENIEPTRSRARLVLEKGPDHAVRGIRLKR